MPAGARRILDLGCASGDLGAALKRARAPRWSGSSSTADYARDAERRLDRVVCADVETALADVERPRPLRLRDRGRRPRAPRRPVDARSGSPSRLLEPGGTAVVCLPNVRYLLSLLAAVPPGPLAARARRPLRRDAPALVHAARRPRAARAGRPAVVEVEPAVLLRLAAARWRGLLARTPLAPFLRRAIRPAGTPARMSAGTRLLVIAADRLDGQVAGTSIRALELARALRPTRTCSSPRSATPPAEIAGCPCVGYHPHARAALRAALRDADVVVVAPAVAAGDARAAALRRAADLRPLRPRGARDARAASPATGALRARDAHALTIDRLGRRAAHRRPLRVRQRDASATCWLGVLLAERLIDPARLRRATRRCARCSTSCRSACRPSRRDGDRRRRAARFPADRRRTTRSCCGTAGCGRGSTPPTAIRAVGGARRAPARPCGSCSWARRRQLPRAARAPSEARALAAELGVLDRVVLFNDDWVPYEQRADWLLDAACAISHAPRPPRDPLRVPHAAARLLLGRPAGRLHARATTSPTSWSAWRGRAVPARRRRCRGGRARERAGPRPRRVRARARARPPPTTPGTRSRSRSSGWSRPRRRRARSSAPRPSHALRRGAYLGARAGLNAVGLRDWPRL